MMKRIIYIKSTGEIIAKTETYQDIKTLYRERTIEYINSLGSIIVENPPKKLNLYKVVDGKLVRYTEQELKEKRQYGRILTKEERQLQKLKPSPEEVRKAENTIEILTLIQEVM